MNTVTRLAIIGSCALLCAGATIVANSTRDGDTDAQDSFHWSDLNELSGNYRQVASQSSKELTFRQLESIVRRHALAASYHARMEFGAIEVTGSTASVQVLFLAPNGEICPVVYHLNAKRNSWKVVDAQRIWFVPRSRLLRGVRA